MGRHGATDTGGNKGLCGAARQDPYWGEDGYQENTRLGVENYTRVDGVFILLLEPTESVAQPRQQV